MHEVTWARVDSGTCSSREDRNNRNRPKAPQNRLPTGLHSTNSARHRHRIFIISNEPTEGKLLWVQGLEQNEPYRQYQYVFSALILVVPRNQRRDERTVCATCPYDGESEMSWDEI